MGKRKRRRHKKVQQVESGAPLQARFDAAQTTDLNSKHWGNADNLSPNTSCSASVRRVLRSRSRYETRNNSWLKGMLQTRTNFIVGRGPRLQMRTGEGAAARDIEASWNAWIKERRFAEQLRAITMAYQQDGESFCQFVTDRFSNHPVQLGLRLYETDQIADPVWSAFPDDDDNRIDGIKLDRNGNPRSYHVLRTHPGALGGVFPESKGRWVGSKQILHLYREERPGQRRGVPLITPSLPLFAILRRYTLATVSTAETAANIAGTVHSDMAADTQDVADVDALMEIPMVRNSFLTLPYGWKLTQVKAEQPAQNYAEFVNILLSEVSRCLDMPHNIATADSSKHNYASGRLDHQIFYQAIEIERQRLVESVLDPVLEQFLSEYLATKSGIAPSDIDMSQYNHVWGFDATPHADPLKAAQSDIVYWDKGLLTDEEYFLRQNIDPETHWEQLKKSLELREEMGAPMPGVFSQSVVGTPDAETQTETAPQS